MRTLLVLPIVMITFSCFAQKLKKEVKPKNETFPYKEFLKGNASIDADLAFSLTWNEREYSDQECLYQFVTTDHTKAVGPVFSDPLNLNYDDNVYNGPKDSLLCKRNGKYGAMYYDGTVVLPFIYDEGTQMRGAMFLRNNGEAWKQYKGGKLVPLEGKLLDNGVAGYILLKKEDRLLFTDELGKTHTSFTLTYSKEKPGTYRFEVVEDGKYGLGISDGTYLIPAKFDSLKTSYNRTVAWQDGKCGLVDDTGKFISEVRYHDIYIGDKDVCIYILPNKQQGLININGKEIGSRTYDQIQFSSTAFIVSTSVGKGLIGLNGEIIAEPIYDAVGGLANDRAFVQLDDKIGYVDSSGNLAIPMIFTESSNKYGKYFKNGFAQLLKDGKCVVIDVNGNVVKECK